MAKTLDDTIRGIKETDEREWQGKANKVKPIKGKQEHWIKVQKNLSLVLDGGDTAWQLIWKIPQGEVMGCYSICVNSVNWAIGKTNGILF